MQKTDGEKRQRCAENMFAIMVDADDYVCPHEFLAKCGMADAAVQAAVDGAERRGLVYRYHYGHAEPRESKWCYQTSHTIRDDTRFAAVQVFAELHPSFAAYFDDVEWFCRHFLRRRYSRVRCRPVGGDRYEQQYLVYLLLRAEPATFAQLQERSGLSTLALRKALVPIDWAGSRLQRTAGPDGLYSVLENSGIERARGATFGILNPTTTARALTARIEAAEAALGFRSYCYERDAWYKDAKAVLTLDASGYPKEAK